MYTKPFDIVICPTGSLFAKTLQNGLKAKVKNSVFRRETPKTVQAKPAIISRRGNVLRAAVPGFVRKHFVVTPKTLNKVEQFRQFVAAGVSCPKHATDPNAVTRNDLGRVVFARTLINSTNGRGIVEINLEDENNVIPHAPLYTEYIPKKAEYRVHVFNGKVIDIQQKKKKRGVEERDTRIRNIQNGYVYTRNDVVPPDGIGALAIAAVNAVGYSYGAVDIIYNEKRNQCYVLEVNSRPGLMGTTLEKYVEALVETYELERK